MILLLTELKDIVAPAHTALIIVDPEHDFCSSEGFFARRLGMDLSRIQAAVPRLNNFIEECRKAGVLVVWIREILAANKMTPSLKGVLSSFGMTDDWVVSEGSRGTEWYEEMIPPREDEPVVIKWHFDGFEDTELDLLLRNNGIKTLLMTGFTSNGCVETTARHGFTKGYYIVAVSDCTDSTSKEEWESAMFNLGRYFGKVATSGEIVALWK